ncbi:macrolide family glycosyltransferase [Streptomyces sp. BBFR25]|uniref:macrolide family glycosyltransferase n=1 Tax=Streptomyces sp. BBFR25 TaxID=3372855 RepID=UPI0037DCEE08
MSTVAFLNIGMHGHVNPTLPVVSELVKRGHKVTYHIWPSFRAAIENTGAEVRLYPGGAPPLPDPVTPLTLLEALAGTAVRLLPTVLAELRDIGPDLIVHDNTCPWGAVAARELGVPAVSSFTTFAYNRQVPSPTSASWDLLTQVTAKPRHLQGYVRNRRELHRRFDTHDVPLVDLSGIRQHLNLVYTSQAFQPDAEDFDTSYRFVGPSIGARPDDPTFPLDGLRDPVLYASLGTVFDATPGLLRTFATALAPLGGTVVLSTGKADPAVLGPLPDNVIARRFVPQTRVLERTALLVTHGGMNSVNEALYAGIPMLVIPQGADQPLVAGRVVELGAGLSMHTQDVSEQSVRALARRLLEEPRFRKAAAAMREAQREPGGFRRAADELEQYLRTAARVPRAGGDGARHG